MILRIELSFATNAPPTIELQRISERAIPESLMSRRFYGISDALSAFALLSKIIGLSNLSKEDLS